MSDVARPAAEADHLIHRLKSAQRSRRTARNLMTLLIVGVILVFLGLWYFAFDSFDEQKQAALMDALTEEATYLMPEVQDQLVAAGERLIPAYRDAFSQTFAENEQAYYDLVETEFAKLEEHGQEAWPRIQQAINDLLFEQEQTVRTKLSEYLSDEELDALTQQYNEELSARLERYFRMRHSENIVLAEGLFDKLEALAEAEGSLPQADTQYIIGMFVELLGIEMQRNSEGL
jgi:hypothetical protein